MRFSESRMDVLKTNHGEKLDIHIWEPDSTPKAVLMAIHGGLAHAGDYVTPALYFKEKEVATVSYDLHGHKQEKIFISSFDRFVDDTAEFLKWTKNAYPDTPVFVVGHSMGALIATHFGIRYANHDPAIKGYLLSSPYYGNAIKVSPIMIPIIKLFGKIIPRVVIPGPDLTDLLTHDETILQRHREDEADHIRGSKPTMRFGSELLKAQKWVQENFDQWRHPTFAVIAGADQVADAEISEALFNRLDPNLLTCVVHKDNYHENFNELNRSETFDKMYAWMSERMG